MSSNTVKVGGVQAGSVRLDLERALIRRSHSTCELANMEGGFWEILGSMTTQIRSLFLNQPQVNLDKKRGSEHGSVPYLSPLSEEMSLIRIDAIGTSEYGFTSILQAVNQPIELCANAAHPPSHFIKMLSQILSAVFFGIVAQLVVSPIYEVPTLALLTAYGSAVCGLLAYLIHANPGQWTTAGIEFLSMNTAFFFAAFGLTAARRLYFSPLSKFPGPRLAALSKLWIANEYRNGRTSIKFKDMHKEFGSDIVRIGPHDLSVIDVDAISKIFAGKYPRGTFYEMGRINAEFNLNTNRNYKSHVVWRRIWERAFVSRELKNYNPLVEHHVSKLIKILKVSALKGQEVNFTATINSLVFDITGDIGFSYDMGMQDGTGDGAYMNFMHKYMAFAGIVGSLRNIAQLLAYIPENTEVRSYRLNGENILARRQKLGSSRKDIVRHFLNEDSDTGLRFTQKELNSNANLIILGGTDTTASTVAQAFRMLAKQPRVLKKLQKEVDEVCDRGDELTVETTQNLPYVNAVMNEALRLFSPTPGGAMAATPPQGLDLNGTFIPGNIQIQVPHSVVMTDERYFPRGEEYIPERWTGERPDLLLDRRAFIPFGYGVHSCVGKPLAMNEMRLVISRLSREFDVTTGESYDQAKFEEDWMDFVVVKLGVLPLKFTLRRRE
ncbi:hypothetical protein B7494_g1212 [Chlorociboria aeruginascens]|nr:hypothetical protein B7494_g1212 [Chlorociboria aeruginascens]